MTSKLRNTASGAFRLGDQFIVSALPSRPYSELSIALRRCVHAFLGVGIMSALINILYLTGSFYMLEVYDRVLASRSIPTLIGISVLAGGLYVFQGLLEVVRTRILIRVACATDEALSARVYGIVTRIPLRIRGDADSLQPMRDLDQLRGFLSSYGPASFFDLPWLPIYLFICFQFHSLIGITATCGALVLVSLTVLTELLIRRKTRRLLVESSARGRIIEAGRRNAEVLQAMGMRGRMAAAFEAVNLRYMDSQRRVADIGGELGAISRVARMALQSCVLGVGGYLVINDEATPGIIIAGSILAARAVAPVEMVIANWRGFVSARQGWHRLEQVLRTFPAETEPMELPAPTRTLAVEGLFVAPPGRQEFTVRDVNLWVKAGHALGIVGPSAAGKSSLARAIVGAWPISRGNVRLDGAAIGQWSSEALGIHIGYLPQDIELFEGTVAENISRFDPDAGADAIISAAKAAGVHDLIIRLENGYATEIGEGGMVLSAGQRQRIALARALYGYPFLVVLDEPYSNLDAEGVTALSQAIHGVRERGGALIIVAHQPVALAGVDHLLVMENGQVHDFGPKDDVLKKLMRPAAVQAAGTSASFTVVSEAG